MVDMDGSVSYIHSTGALICVFASFLAAVVSYLALRSRGRANRRGITHSGGSTSVPLCKICHQLVKNAPSQDCGTKEWMCSACTGSIEVRNYMESCYSHFTVFIPRKLHECFGTEPMICPWHG